VAIPDYQTLMLPYLHIVGDGAVHTHTDIIDRLAIQFNLSPEDLKELLPSGTQSRFANRVYWVSADFRKAGLIENIGRGSYKITAKGTALLSENPKQLRIKDLQERYEEYKIYKRGKKPEDNNSTPEREIETSQTPEELFASGYISLKEKLASDLIDLLKKCSPSFFERIVVELLVAMGYGGSYADAAEVIGKSGDAGIDGIIKEDKLGLDSIYIQAKRWEGNVSRPTVQAFAGAIEGRRAKKGVLITTSYFTDEAKRYVENIEKKIVLIDGERLADLMIDFNVGVTTVETYLIKKVDSDYFIEE
jgi:restriction system protein